MKNSAQSSCKPNPLPDICLSHQERWDLEMKDTEYNALKKACQNSITAEQLVASRRVVDKLLAKNEERLAKIASVGVADRTKRQAKMLEALLRKKAFIETIQYGLTQHLQLAWTTLNDDVEELGISITRPV